MDNILYISNKKYYLEKIWRKNKKDYKRDSNGNVFPYPKKGQQWKKKGFILRLEIIQKILYHKKKYYNYIKKKKCLICKKKNIGTRIYKSKNIIWENSLIHYIKKHNIDPNFKFKKFIYINNFFKNKLPKEIIFFSNKVKKYNKEYFILSHNQILILDALMIGGGYEKKYQNKKNKRINKYSEHAGAIVFYNKKVNKIIVSGKTNRINEDDKDILLPTDQKFFYKYEYIFHTHPPTSGICGRVIDNIIYEFPSINDIFNFIHIYNNGKIIGSLVISPEGLYNIRKYNENKKKIYINEDKLFHNYQKLTYKIQLDTIKKYGRKISKNLFYSKIIQDYAFINKLNNLLHKYNIHIDYYSRKKISNNKWYIGSILLEYNKK